MKMSMSGAGRQLVRDGLNRMGPQMARSSRTLPQEGVTEAASLHTSLQHVPLRQG